MIRVANAPCSWGVLEFDAEALRRGSGQAVRPGSGQAAGVPASQVLDEMAAAGYTGTELGDWGFLPTDPTSLRSEVGRRGLALVGAFVPIAFAREDALEEGIERAIRTAQLMRTATQREGSHSFSSGRSAEEGSGPLVVLSDDNTTVPHRTARAGRIRPDDGLAPNQWDGFAERASSVAAAVREASGLRTVFHHHCAGYVETPREIDALMSRTPADLVGLCLDTGHVWYGGGNALDAIAKYRDRIWHVHFKDCEPDIAHRARDHAWDYHTAVRHGIFCELGKGAVPFGQVLDALRVESYDGWIVVEQDVLPGLGTPAASASRNRQYLSRLGL